MAHATLPVCLGLAGLIPFVAASIGAALLPDVFQPVAFYAATVYAVAILSFLGGVHWGLGVADGRRWRFLWAVTPSLIAFFAMFAPKPLALYALTGGFALAGVVDVLIFRRDGPAWYAGLRAGLTIVVCGCLLFLAARADAWRVDPFGVVING
ncbi:MAG: DUF3429 domain-containing protein [Pseudomonadota bacterium]